MHTYTIHIDGLAYQGEAVEEYETNIGADGWHVPNQGALNELVIGPGAPMQIKGWRNLSSEVARIVRRMSDGRIAPRQIVITVEE
jgi:hypothetical protein